MKMKSFLIASSLFLFALTSIHAQDSVADSLRQLLTGTKDDTSRVLILAKLSSAYIYSEPDSAMKFAHEGLRLAQKIKYFMGEAWCLNAIGATLMVTGNYPKALETYHEALKLRELINDSAGIAASMTNIGIIYAQQGDYRQALQYLFKAKEIDEALQDERNITSDLLNIGEAYNKMNRIDSALLFTQRAYEMALQHKVEDKMGTVLNNLGNIHSKMANNNLALEFYRLGISFSITRGNKNVLGESYFGIAEIYKKSAQGDSAIYFAKKALITGQESSDPIIVSDAGMLLADLYETANANDSAFHYFKIAVAAKDSVFSEEKVRQVQVLGFNERLRQQEIAEEKARAAKARMDNLQYTGIALFILTFFILLLILSARKVKPGVIEFFGLLGLLLVFEFISVLLDPVIGKFTHHTPVFILLISVAVASLLVPIHHYLTRVVKEKLGRRT